MNVTKIDDVLFIQTPAIDPESDTRSLSRELKEDGAEATRKLRDKGLEVEELEARLHGQSNSFKDLEKKYRTLQAKFSIAKRMSDFQDSENQKLRDLLDLEREKIWGTEESLSSGAAENSQTR